MIHIPMQSKGAISLSQLEQLQQPIKPQPSATAPTHRPQPAPNPIPPQARPNQTNHATTNGVAMIKGQKISLSQLNPNLRNIKVCLGWDVSNRAIDLDVEAFLLGADGKVLGEDWFVFYNQPQSPDGAVFHSGDNKTGIGDGDDEILSIDLQRLNPAVQKIIFVVTIADAFQNGYRFNQINHAFARVVDADTNQELIRFHLTEYDERIVSMMVGELYYKGNQWRFSAIGNGTSDDLLGLCNRYGVEVMED